MNQCELKELYVKSEFMNYGYYKSELKRCEERLHQIGEALKEERYEFTIAKQFRTCSSLPLFMMNELMEEEAQLISKKQRIEEHLQTMEEWLSCLNDVQSEIIQTYVMQHRCMDRMMIAQELGYSERAISKILQQGITRIAKQFL